MVALRLHKKLWKDSFREIWKTKQQFLAIFAIIALGSGFYSGIKLASPDMLLTAKNYYEDTQLSDFNLLCTYGITQEDVEDLEQQSFVSQVQPSYYCDVFSNNESSEDGSESVVRLYSYSPSDTLNQLTVVAGRLPESANECVVDSGSLGTSNEDALNTTVSFSLEDSQLSDQLTNTSYTVVGVVESPLYVNFQRGSTTIGNGTLSAFYYIPEENFQSDYYTNCYVRIDGAAGLDPYGDEYDALIDEATEKLEQWGEERAAVRLPQVQAEAMDAYNESKAQFDQASAEAQAQLQDAWNQLEAGRLELESGRAALEQATQQYEEGIRQGEQRLNEAKTQLEQAQIELSVQKAVAQANVASSTTQILATIFHMAKATLSRELAEALALGLITDTGGFRHANASPEVFALAALLEQAGVSIHRLREHLEKNWTAAKMRLWGMMSAAMEFMDGERVAMTTLSMEALEKSGARPEDTEGFVEHLRELRTVEIAVFLREQSPNVCKFSLRSIEELDVHAIAASLGGGGHRNASGGTLAMPLENARRLLVKTVLAARGQADPGKAQI